MSPVGFPGFSTSEYLSPENFTSGFGKTAGNYLSPEFLEFLRAELLRCGKALRTVAPALEHENREVKEQAHLAATAQFFYALGLLYTRGLIIPPRGTRDYEPSGGTITCDRLRGIWRSVRTLCPRTVPGPRDGPGAGRTLGKGTYLFPRLGPRLGTIGAGKGRDR